MWPFKKKKPVDVGEAITNPELKSAFHRFNLNQSNEMLNNVLLEIKKANFLVLVNDEQLVKSKSPEDGHITLEQGSIIKFLLTYDEKGNCFFPLFTDWEEVDLWVKSRKNIFGWVMPTYEAFNFVLGSKSVVGLVINPCSNRWNMNKEQVTNFLNEI